MSTKAYKLSQSEFNQVIQLLREGKGAESIAKIINKSCGITTWCVRLIDKQGLEKSEEFLVHGSRPKYSDEALRSIAALNVHSGISAEELEVSFLINRNRMGKLLKKYAAAGDDLSDVLPAKMPVFESHKAKLRSEYALVVNNVSKALDDETFGHQKEQIAKDVSQLILEDKAVVGVCLQDNASGEQAGPVKLGQNNIIGVSCFANALEATDTEHTSEQPAQNRWFGNAVAPIKVYRPAKVNRRKDLAAINKEQQILLAQQNQQNELPDKDKIEQLQNEAIAKERASKIQKVLGAPRPLIPVSQYLSGNPDCQAKQGPTPNLDPNSEGFGKLSNDVQDRVLEKQAKEAEIRATAKDILGSFSDSQLKDKPNVIRYILLDSFIEAFPDEKQTFLCACINLSLRMKYYYDKHPWDKSKYEPIFDLVRELFKKSHNTYGKVRMCQALREHGVYLSVPTVRKVMRQLNLCALTNQRNTKRYSSYQGEVGKLFPDLIKRDFNVVERFGEIIVTDVTEFNVKGKKLYLSAMLDVYTRSVVSYSLSCSPTVSFVVDSLQRALDVIPSDVQCIIHSDQGHQYQRDAYTKLIEQAPNVKQSMSRKGVCLDNYLAEGFFGTLKREMFKGRSFNSLDELATEIISYIERYNTERLHSGLGYKTPMEAYQAQQHNPAKDAPSVA